VIAFQIPHRMLSTLGVLFISMSFVLASCNGDKSTGPLGAQCSVSGITSTDAQGTILSTDPDDWCHGGAGPSLGPAFPNPSSPGVSIPYSLTSSLHVTMQIMDHNCHVIRTLVIQQKQAGPYTVLWDGHDDSDQPLPPGIYRCVLEAGTFTCHGDIELQ
jgi:hypothetical protein